MQITDKKKECYSYCIWSHPCTQDLTSLNRFLCCNDCTDKKCEWRCTDDKNKCKYKETYQNIYNERIKLKLPWEEEAKSVANDIKEGLTEAIEFEKGKVQANITTLSTDEKPKKRGRKKKNQESIVQQTIEQPKKKRGRLRKQ